MLTECEHNVILVRKEIDMRSSDSVEVIKMQYQFLLTSLLIATASLIVARGWHQG